jgi:hypothetical protein
MQPCLFSKLLESPPFAGEGKGSGCDRLIRAVEQPAKRGKDQRMAATRTVKLLG